MWSFRWLERPATTVIQFEVSGEVRGSLSLDKGDKKSQQLWQRLQEYLLDIQSDELDSHTIINRKTG